MSVLWCGGEDIDFPNGTAVTVDTVAGKFRSTYTRCCVYVNISSSLAKSVPFSGGAITSCWLAARLFLNSTSGQNRYGFGIGLSGTNKCLMIGSSAAINNQLALCTYDGTTITQLATETGTSALNSLNVTGTARLDIQVVNFGATATINVFINGVLYLTFTGNVTLSGFTNFDSVFLGTSNNTNNPFWETSEIIVANEDTRSWPALMTMALTGVGNLNQWTNPTFSNINGITLSDASPASDNVNAQKQEYNITDLAAGTYVIKAVKIAARMAKSATPAVTQVALGYNHNGGTPAYGTGSTKAVTTAYTTYEQLDLTDPVTGIAWAQSDMNTLQLDMEALT